MVERVITALIVKPNKKQILKEVFNSRSGIARIIGIEEDKLGSICLRTSRIYYPRFLDIHYCLRNGTIPYPIVILKKGDYADHESYEMALNSSYLTIDNAFVALEEMNLNVDELIDGRLFFRSDTDVMDFIVNHVLHRKEVSLVAKIILTFIQRYNFDITMSRIAEHFKEDIAALDQGMEELVKLNLIGETRLDDDRYFIVNPSCVKEAEILLKGFTNTSLEPVVISDKCTQSNQREELFEKGNVAEKSNQFGETDYLLGDAMKIVIKEQKASVSMLQRKLRIGYTRAARLVDTMEELGVVAPYAGSKPREVLVKNIDELNKVKSEVK